MLSPEGIRNSGSRAAGKGTAIVNLLNVTGDEKITAVIPVKKFEDELFLMAATRLGVVKRHRWWNTILPVGMGLSPSIWKTTTN